MADYYDTSVKVIGSIKENVKHFVELFEDEGYNGQYFYDSVINYDVHPSDIEIEEEGGMFTACFMVKCKNSVYACMMDGEDTGYGYYTRHPEQYEEIKPCTLEQACLELGLEAEIWSMHPDYYEEECYYEHYFFRNGTFEISENDEMPLTFAYDPDEYEDGEKVSYQKYIDNEIYDISKAAIQCVVPEEEWDEAVESGEYTEWTIDPEEWEDVFWRVVRRVSVLTTK